MNMKTTDETAVVSEDQESTTTIDCDACTVNDLSFINSTDRYFQVKMCEQCGKPLIAPTPIEIGKRVWVMSDQDTATNSPVRFFNMIDGASVLTGIHGDEDYHLNFVFGKHTFLLKGEDSKKEKGVALYQFDTDGVDERVRFQSSDNVVMLAGKLSKNDDGWMTFAMVNNNLFVRRITTSPLINEGCPYSVFTTQLITHQEVALTPILQLNESESATAVDAEDVFHQLLAFYTSYA